MTHKPDCFLLYTEDEQFRHAFARTFRLWTETVCIDAGLAHLPSREPVPAPEKRSILFLDIDGLGSCLETLVPPPAGALILCSRDPARSITCYALHPADFLPKPVSLSALERALERCIPLWQDRLKWLDLSAGRIQVPLCELLWAEASGHSCVLHCVHGVVRASESLSKLAVHLPQTLFLRCQRSFVVNLRHIQSLEDGYFNMAGGGQVPIGRGSREQAAQAYQSFRQLFQE